MKSKLLSVEHWVKTIDSIRVEELKHTISFRYWRMAKRFFYTMFHWRMFCSHFRWHKQKNGMWVRHSTTIFDDTCDTKMKCTMCGRNNI